MAFNQKIAIPHTTQNKNDEITIAIGVFKEARLYHEIPIHIVLLMAIPSEIDCENNTLIRIYDEILTIVKDEEIIQKIADAKNYSDFCKALYKKF